MSDHDDRTHDRGSATVWAATGVAVIMIVFLVGLHLGAAVIARHRAEAAADLAALAAAGLAVEGTEAACARADEIAGAMGGTVTDCRLAGWDALVEVRVPISIAFPGIDAAAGRARAGPVPTTDDSVPAPPVVETTPPNDPAEAHLIAIGFALQLAIRTTSGRPTQAGGRAHRGAHQLVTSRVRPTTRRTTRTLVVTPVPITDKHWQREDPTRLLDGVTGRARPVGPPEVAPQTAVGPERPNRRPPTSGPPHADRRRPARPPTWPAGDGLSRGRAHGRADPSAQHVEHHVQQPHRP